VDAGFIQGVRMPLKDVKMRSRKLIGSSPATGFAATTTEPCGKKDS